MTIKIIILILGVIFTIYGLVLAMMSNLNLGVMLTLALGVFILLLGCFYGKIQILSSHLFFKITVIAVIILLCAEAILVGFIALYGHNDNVDYSEDAIIVLGAGLHGDVISTPLKYRLDKTIEYHSKNPDALIVVTGGQGLQETVTEASAMEKYLIKNGVDKNKIIKEEKATSTNENMRFSKEILDAYFEDEYKIAVITNNFHIYRATAIAKIEGFKNVSHLHTGLQWYNLVPCYLRESLAVLKMWIVG
ncbi:MAG: YdcF family protein [Ruminococcaceae bacterium]|nr:YdcF family protein [Oscillospiraceae bacterium]